MKRALSFILSIVMVMGIFISVPVTVSAANENIFDFTKMGDDGCYIARCDPSAQGEVKIPSTYYGLTVTGIMPSAFADCVDIESVIIPDSITDIMRTAFYNCTKLDSIKIPDSVTNIGESAFYNTAYYNNAENWENGVLYIDNHLIQGKETLNGGCKIKNGTKTIAAAAFWGCHSLTSVEIPDSVTSIGEGAFVGCEGLTSVEIPDFVTSIDHGTFSGCKNLTSIVIPDCVTEIGEYAFHNCTSLKSMTLPDSVTNIGGYAFHNCTSLKSITLPDSITNIGMSAFFDSGYYQDTQNWENGVLYIGKYLIDVASYLNGSFTIKNGTKYIAGGAFYNCENLTSITLPDSVTSIGDSAFRYCTNLTSIALPDGLTSIGVSAFSDCTSLKSITLPDSLTSLGGLAFNLCKGLESIKIPVGLTKIEYGTFSDCTNLESVTIPAGVTDVYQGAFNKATNIKSVYIDDLTSWCNICFYDQRSNPLSFGGNLYVNGELLKNLVIPSEIKRINLYAFVGCNSIVSLTIPHSVEAIELDAFSSCKNLEKISIADNSALTLGIAFYDTAYYNNEDNWENDMLYIDGYLIKAKYKSDGNYKIKDGTKYICNFAFEDCENLKSIKIPDSVKGVGNNAFNNTAYYKNEANWENDVLYIGNYLIKAKETLKGSYIIKSGTKCIGDNAFVLCDEITSVKIPNSVTNIGSYAFLFCVGLEDVTIPDSVMYIGDYAFYNCTGVKAVTIPTSVSEIGTKAFGYYLKSLSSNVENQHGKISGYIIYGAEGSAAEAYAKENGLVFNECKHKESHWIIDKAATVNATGKKHKECNYCGKILETAVISQLKPATPKLTKIQNTASGVKVSWGKVTGADSYIVYRRTYDAKTKTWGGWARLATPKGNATVSYLDKTAKSGYYRYTVKAVNEAGNSGFDTSGIKTYFLAVPKSVTTSNTTNTITVKWGKVTGATGYIVYRKTGDGKWTNLGKTTGTSFADKTAKAGVTYKYTIKAYYGSYVSAYNTNGYAVRRLTIPTLKSAVSSKTGITFTWNKVTGATGYIVYRKTGSGSWQRLGTVKTNTYLDKTAKKGVTYTYTVKAYYGTSTSHYNSKGLTVKDKY